MSESAGIAPIADAGERRRALDVEQSFIVQAPAGSGKTELLIQRYLALLARVDAPEEIVAVTFTRKASAEMRARVLEALQAAAADRPPAQPHRLQTWRLARAVRERDTTLRWGLDGAPSRLRLHTIDALCASLTRQMPVLSGFGAQPESLDDADELYVETARRTLGLLDAGGAEGEAVRHLLVHLDNDLTLVESLLARMLARRDQWLRHVADTASGKLERAALEQALAAWVEDHVRDLVLLFPARLADQLCRTVREAAANLATAGRASDLLGVADLERLPDGSANGIDVWRALASFVLTKDGNPRQRFDVKVGCPAPSGTKDPDEKARRQALIQSGQNIAAQIGADPDLAKLLHGIRLLPPLFYTDAQWVVLSALIDILPTAVAELTLLFRERRQVDFTATAQAAVRALGPEGEPTDLALALDYRIRHLLVDEFQDTSQSQYELLTRLTAGWERGDGRTLFVVGDPMQSIYRFREAEVGLYLRARREGIGTVPLAALRLEVNFRSQAGIVDWLNRTFRQILPAREDIGVGAVPHAPSIAVHPALPGEAVIVHPLVESDDTDEAQRIAQVVRDELAVDGRRTVAILVRARAHLAAIVPALKAAGLRPQAIEVEALGERPIIQDLRALTRALLHPADRLAWLAVLRAPWCGLSLADLEQLAGADRHAVIPDLLAADGDFARLSDDGRGRAVALRDRLRPVIARRRRGPLRRWVEHAWLAIGGPATAADPADLDDATVFFDLLDQLDDGGDLVDFAALDAGLETLFARPDPAADPRLLVMTMHKAKGLEFDVVILPRLGSRPRGNDAALLLWLERPRPHGAIDLVLAPIGDRAGQGAAMYDAVRGLEAEKDRHEVVRLLYVAATRARSRVHLFGNCAVKDGQPSVPRGSLSSVLWPVVAADFEAAVAQHSAGHPDGTDAEDEQRAAQAIRRFPAGWQPPLPAAGVVVPVATVPGAGDAALQVEFSWASETARYVGTVVHRWLQTIAEEGPEQWTAARVVSLGGVFARDLATLGVPAMSAAMALPRVIGALTAALDDERARWILSGHAEARNELRLATVVDGLILHIAIDRTFVDATGTRWIIDYKTGIREGADREGFLDNEQVRYRDQLERYAAAFAAVDSRPIRLGLYFPSMQGWREWQAG